MSFGDSKIDFSSLTALERSISPAFRHGETEAVKRGLATTRKLMINFGKTGGEGTWDQPSPFTKLMRRNTPPEDPALSLFSKLHAFKLDSGLSATDEVSGVVGHSPFLSRKKGKVRGISPRSIKNAYRAKKRTMSRNSQRRAAIRAYRLARHGNKPGLARARVTKWSRLTDSEKFAARKILSVIPRVGTDISTPEREMPETVLQKHGDEIARKMDETFTKRYAEKLR